MIVFDADDGLVLAAFLDDASVQRFFEAIVDGERVCSSGSSQAIQHDEFLHRGRGVGVRFHVPSCLLQPPFELLKCSRDVFDQPFECQLVWI